MEKSQLQEIFQRPFDPAVWRTILIDVFGADKLYEQPKPRELENGGNPKVQGYDLGEIVTPDKYTIGLFQFEIKEGHKIPMNRVGLRGLVEKDIKYFYDAAIVVYYNDSQWRVSFICDIKGEATAPKRFTYVFGDRAQSYRTPARQFNLIKTKGASKDVIHEAFSVEALNTDFYKFIAGRFYELVGATTGQGKNKTVHERTMRLPGEQNNLVYQEFAVRLIGRTVFCWFLKEKKSGDGKPLLPVELLSSKSLETHSDYYHTVLERIFFQTLNTPPEERVADLPEGCELIPFLNGGLFDPKQFDFFGPEHRYEVHIPDEWFAALFSELEQYNFTIDENSPDDIEVSVDPEMLGRIFENLLAEIDPDSGETARKATGSFYTPREIVDYMAVESLVYYLNRKTGIDRETIYPLFKPMDAPGYTVAQREKLLVALDELKILDPACGSGAFPMGVLAKITGALKILDGDGSWWKERQVRRIDNAAVRHQMQEKLDAATVEYARKIGIIQNTLYGVDIQPIAAEISKLRCFLTLIVDENVDDTKPNRGVDPLPNLEFKFITADSLLKLPPVSDFGGLFGRDTTYELTEKLRQLRIDYLQSYGDTKKQIKIKYLTLLTQFAFANASDSTVDTTSREYLIGSWNPFSNEKSDWFDPEWMFGVKDGFDIVIGNPPYVEAKKLKKVSAKLKPDYDIYSGTADLSCYFAERGINLTKQQGLLLFIITNKFFYTNYGEKVRSYLLKHNLYELINFEQVEVFENTLVSSVVMGVVNESAIESNEFMYEEFHKLKRKEFLKQFNLKKDFWGSYPQSQLSSSEWSFSDDTQSEVQQKIESGCSILSNIPGVSIFRGATTGYNPAFIIDEFLKQSLIDIDPCNTVIIKPLLQGRHIRKWYYNYCGEHLIFTKQGIKIEDYPEIKAHLAQFQPMLEPRKENDGDITNDTKEKKGRKPGSYYWYEIQDNTAYYPEFERPEKIIWGLTADKWAFAYDDRQHYLPSNGYILTSTIVPIKYLLAILNSNLIKYYFGFIGVMTAGGAYTLKHSTIQRLPVRIAENVQSFIDLVDQILAAKSADSAADTSALESEIDRMVYDLYGLTDEEVKIIENN